MRNVRHLSLLFAASAALIAGSAHAAPTSTGDKVTLKLNEPIAVPDIQSADSLIWKEANNKGKSKVKKGSLTKQQKTQFKARKKKIKAAERRNIRLVKQWTPAVKRAQRTQARTDIARARSRAKITKMQNKMEAFREKARAKQVGNDPLAAALQPAFSTKVQAKLDRMQVAIDRAETRHTNGPKQRDLDAIAQLQSSRSTLNQAQLGRDAARLELKVRKSDKNHARSRNLQQAVQLKVQRAVRSGPLVAPPPAQAPARQNVYGVAPKIVSNDTTYSLAPAPAGVYGGMYGAAPPIRLNQYDRVDQPLVP